MKLRILTLAVGVAFVAIIVKGGTIRHVAKPPSVVSGDEPDGQMHGWASRLDIEADSSAFDGELEGLECRRREVARTAAKGGSDDVSLLMTLLNRITLPSWLWLAWQWLFGSTLPLLSSQLVEAQHLPPPPITTTLWNDTVPRFIAYGDSYVANNSFGVPDPKWLTGFGYYNIAFWVSNGGDGNGAADNVAEWTRASSKQRKAIVKAYNDAGIRLGIALFGADDKPQSNGNDAAALARRIASFVQTYNLQGVDVDYEEYDKFEQRQATKWIIPLTRALRNALPANQYYLSHAPIAPLFNADQYPLGYTWVERDIGSLIDWYNVQFYNQDDYATCDSLVHTAQGQWPNTALLQISRTYGVPLSKLVVGKPAHKADADNGYMSPGVLASCLATEAAPSGWNAGCMWWEYRGNLTRNIAPIKKALKW